MNLLVVMPYFFPATIYGGPIYASLNLCIQTAKLGVNINVITTDVNGKNKIQARKNEFLDLENFSVKYCNEQLANFFSFHLLYSLWFEIKKADVVHVQPIYSYTTPITLFYCFLLKKKVLISPRGSLAKWSFNKRGLLKVLWIKLFIYPFSKDAVWLSTSRKESLEILAFFKKATIKSLSDGVNLINSFEKKNCKWSNLNYIAALGRIHSVKGYDILIKAMAKIVKKKPDVKLFIAGNDDGHKNQLIKLINQLDLKNEVQFIGVVKGENKNQFLAHAQCLVLPSQTENFGIVVVESLAVGTPVIASKNTPWQALMDAKAGMFIDNNSDAIYKAYISILENLNEYEKNTKLLAKQYDWKQIAKKYHEILNRL